MIPSSEVLRLCCDKIRLANAMLQLSVPQLEYHLFKPADSKDAISRQLRSFQSTFFSKYGSPDIVLKSNWSSNTRGTFILQGTTAFDSAVTWLWKNRFGPYSQSPYEFMCQKYSFPLSMQEFRCYFFNKQLFHILLTSNDTVIEIVKGQTFVCFDAESKLYKTSQSERGPIAGKLTAFVEKTYKCLLGRKEVQDIDFNEKFQDLDIDILFRIDVSIERKNGEDVFCVNETQPYFEMGFFSNNCSIDLRMISNAYQKIIKRKISKRDSQH